MVILFMPKSSVKAILVGLLLCHAFLSAFLVEMMAWAVLDKMIKSCFIILKQNPVLKFSSHFVTDQFAVSFGLYGAVCSLLFSNKSPRFSVNSYLLIRWLMIAIGCIGFYLKCQGKWTENIPGFHLLSPKSGNFDNGQMNFKMYRFKNQKLFCMFCKFFYHTRKKKF